LEGIAPLSFDIAAFDAMPIAEQLFVISNLERVNRGLAPVLYMTTQLNQYAQAGADTRADPNFPSILTGGAPLKYGDSNWASGFESVLHANYSWMYHDGLNSGNIDCTATDTAGCWGHRDNILLANPGVGCYLAMGAASTGLAYTEIFVGACGVAPTDQVLTWSHALTALGGSGHLAIATTSLLEPASFTSSYLQTLQASDGVGSFSWTLTSGALPPGYELSADGRLSGPLAGPLGVYSFTITVTGSEPPPQPVSATYSLTFPGPQTAALGAMTVDALSGTRGSITITITRSSRTSSARVVGYQVALNGQAWTNLAPTSLNRFVLRHLRSGARYVLRLRAYDARQEYVTSNVVGVVVR
jgi:hypothetical protein